MSNTALPQGPWMLPDKSAGQPLKFEHVWVHLERLCPRPPEDRRRIVIDGLDFTIKVPGLLKEWLRTADGAWLGVVNYKIAYVDGRANRRDCRDQLVPAWALSKREDSNRAP